MLCEICSQNVATVHLTEISNKAKKDVHLCEACAQEKGVASKASHFTLSDLLGGLVESAPEKEPGGKRGKEPVCDSCGLRYSDFKSSGRLGCPRCYDAFERGLVPLLNKIHQADRHVGKTPTRKMEKPANENGELLGLRRDLEEAVRLEEYERAASIRDSIHKLESRLAKEEPKKKS